MNEKYIKPLIILLSIIVTVLIALPIRSYEDSGLHFQIQERGLPFEFVTVYRTTLSESVGFRMDNPFHFSMGSYQYGLNINLIGFFVNFIVVFLVFQYLAKKIKYYYT